jgi:hypothetical protein
VTLHGHRRCEGIREARTPLLSQEGRPISRWAPGWFLKGILQGCGFGTTPRVIAPQSRCPPNLGGQIQVFPKFNSFNRS